MAEWTPQRVTLNILEVEGDDKYFDPGRCMADVKLNSGANIQLDVADPENMGTLQIKDQFDTLRITLKDKTRSIVYGSVNFDAEMFNAHPVAKQWISLHSNSLSDAFKGKIGKDDRATPRILLGYDTVPYDATGERGRTATRRTKETLQQDRGSHDSRRKRSAREISKQSNSNFVVRSNQSRVVSHRDAGGTKTTKVEKNMSSSNRVSSSHQISSSHRVSSNLNVSQRSPKGLSSSIGRGSSTGVRESVRASLKSNMRGKSHMVGGLDHDQAEKDIGRKTSTIINDFNRETNAISSEENRVMQKLDGITKSNAKLERDEDDMINLRNKAVKELDSIRNEAKNIQDEEDHKQDVLLTELEQLENELQDIETNLEEEQMIARQGPDGQITLGGISIKDEQEINDIKQETQEVLEEIRDAIKSNRIPIEESSFDPTFRVDLDDHAKDLIEKEKERHAIELDIAELEGDFKGDNVAADINEANLNYQRTQRDALQKEYDRVVSMYDGVGHDTKRKLDDETNELDDLRDYLRRLENDKVHYRTEIEHLKSDPSLNYSLDGGSVFDDEIKRKLKDAENAEKSRREAEVELDKLYDQWRYRIDRSIDEAYVRLTGPEDKAKSSEIKRVILETDKVTRSLNNLIADKEKLENLLYLRKTNNRLTGTMKTDEKSFHSRMSTIQKEDRELMDELNKSDNALLAKNTALRELDDKIRILSRKYADLEAEAQEKKGLISSLRIKHDHLRLEIERLRGLVNEDEIARLETELRQKEQHLKDLQLDVEDAEEEVIEWREKIILKQRIVKSRSQSRMLLFDPDPNDPVDKRIADYVLSHITTVPVKKVGKNKYLFGTKNIQIVRTNTGPMVKTTDGELVELEHYLETSHDLELQKLDALGDDEHLVVDEKNDFKYGQRGDFSKQGLRSASDQDFHPVKKNISNVMAGMGDKRNESIRQSAATFKGYDEEDAYSPNKSRHGRNRKRNF